MGILILFSIPSFGQYINLPEPESKEKGRVFYRCSAFFEWEPLASFEYKSKMDDFNIESNLWSSGIDLELYGRKSEKKATLGAGVGLGYYSSACSSYTFYNYKSSVNLMGLKVSPHISLVMPQKCSWLAFKVGMNVFINCKARIPDDFNAIWLHEGVLSASMIQYFLGIVFKTRYFDFVSNYIFYGGNNGPLDTDKLTYYNRYPFTSKSNSMFSIGIYIRLFGNGYM